MQVPQAALEVLVRQAARGLAEVPEVPEMPGVPEVPEVQAVPGVPVVPAVQEDAEVTGRIAERTDNRARLPSVP